MNTLKLLFLDFDGVLNTDDDRGLDVDALRPDLIARLNHVLDVTGAVVVVSSDWRLHHTIDQLKDMLKSKGFTGTIVGCTSLIPLKVTGFDSDGNAVHIKPSRADLISDWLKDNGQLDATIAIVDDVPPTFDNKHLLFNRVVLTDSQLGLMPIDADDLIKLLGPSNRDNTIS